MSSVSTGPPDIDEPICHVVTINPHHWNGKTLVLTHGAYHTAQHYLATFDHRPGWAYDFAAAGYRVLVADYPGSGDSPEVAHPELIDEDFVCRGLARVIESAGGPVDLLVHSMSGPYGLALLETHGHLIDHLIAVGPAQPAQLGEKPTLVEDLGESVRVVYGVDEWLLSKKGWTEGNLAFVERCIGPGSRFPAVDPEVYLASLSPLWAGLSIERAQQLLDPPTDLADLSGQPVLVLIGTHDLGHPPGVDERLVEWLRGRGAAAELLKLDDIGIDGNGHMLMLEENSSELAGLIVEWLAR